MQLKVSTFGAIERPDVCIPGMTLLLGKEGGEKLRFTQAMHVPAIIVEGGRIKSYPAVCSTQRCVACFGGIISYVSLRATCCARADFCLERF
jgi:hypothetical protein